MTLSGKKSLLTLTHLRSIMSATPGISSATNPSEYGWHHGPIQNPNASWLPDRQRLAKANDEKVPNVTVDENDSAPNPMLTLSGVNGLICDVLLDDTRMCGMTFTQQPAFRRHLRTQHPGCFKRGSRVNLTSAEVIEGENALKLWVLSGGWKEAEYFHEPNMGPKDGLIGRFVMQFEKEAETNEEFAEEYGNCFRRGGPQPGRSEQKPKSKPEPKPKPKPKPKPDRKVALLRLRRRLARLLAKTKKIMDGLHRPIARLLSRTKRLMNRCQSQLARLVWRSKKAMKMSRSKAQRIWHRNASRSRKARVQQIRTAEAQVSRSRNAIGRR